MMNIRVAIAGQIEAPNHKHWTKDSGIDESQIDRALVRKERVQVQKLIFLFTIQIIAQRESCREKSGYG